MLTQNELDSDKAFYVAEAGLAELTTHLYKKEFGSIADKALGKARYRVNL